MRIHTLTHTRGTYIHVYTDTTDIHTCTNSYTHTLTQHTHTKKNAQPSCMLSWAQLLEAGTKWSGLVEAGRSWVQMAAGWNVQKLAGACSWKMAGSLPELSTPQQVGLGRGQKRLLASVLWEGLGKRCLHFYCKERPAACIGTSN